MQPRGRPDRAPLSALSGARTMSRPLHLHPLEHSSPNLSCPLATAVNVLQRYHSDILLRIAMHAKRGSRAAKLDCRRQRVSRRMPHKVFHSPDPLPTVDSVRTRAATPFWSRTRTSIAGDRRWQTRSATTTRGTGTQTQTTHVCKQKRFTRVSPWIGRNRCESSVRRAKRCARSTLLSSYDSDGPRGRLRAQSRRVRTTTTKRRCATIRVSFVASRDSETGGVSAFVYAHDECVRSTRAAKSQPNAPGAHTHPTTMRF